MTEKEIEQEAAKKGYTIDEEFGPILESEFHFYKGSAKYVTGAFVVLTSRELRQLAYRMDQAEKKFRRTVKV